MLPLLAAAVIYSTTNASASTGGNNAGTGGTVMQGDSYSSSYSETQVNDSGSSGGTLNVSVQTDNNGQVQSENVTKTIPPGGSVDISVATSTSSGNVQSAVHVQTGSSHSFSNVTSSASSTVTATTSSTTIPFASITFSTRLHAFFAHLFSLFGFNF